MAAWVYPDGAPTDDTPAYYRNPAQTHTPGGARADDAGLHERLLFSIYFHILKVAQLGWADLESLCLGVRDVLGLTVDPLVEMRALGPARLRRIFRRLRDELGARYDARALAEIMNSLGPRRALASLRELPGLAPLSQRA